MFGVDMSQLGAQVSAFDDRIKAIETQLNRMEANQATILEFLKNLQPVGEHKVGD